MARDFHINGESLVLVKSRSDSALGSLQELGLASDKITCSPRFKHRDINVDAWGEAPADVQFMLAEVGISMTLIHYDRTILEACIALSTGSNTSEGVLPRAGTRLGGGVARFAAGNNYIGLNISSPVEGRPWRFYFCYLADTPFSYPLGTEKSMVTLNWRAIPYTTDPYQGGVGAQGQVLWDHELDS